MEKWESFKQRVSECNKCKYYNILFHKSYPILMKKQPKHHDVLFILEAPNYDDTFNPKKGYLTYLEDTDPTGNFFSELFWHELGFHDDDLFITNAVQCLPSKDLNGKYSVKAKQIQNCSEHLRYLIETFKPLIVCVVGGIAFEGIKKVEPHTVPQLSASVGKAYPWFGRLLFPLFHPGRLGILNRARAYQKTDPQGYGQQSNAGMPAIGKELQRQDWHKLRLAYEQCKQNRSQLMYP